MMFNRIGSRSSNRLRSKYVRKSRGPKSKMTIPANTEQISMPNLEEELSTLNFEEYKRVLWEKIPSDKKEGCLCFDPLWFGKYMEKKNSGRAEKAIKMKSVEKIFKTRYFFIPICEAGHWELVIICNLDEKTNSESRSPCIILMNSLKQIGGERRDPRLKQFVFDLYIMANKNDCEDFLDIPVLIPNIPQQKDGTKCGYYVLFYMYQFLLQCPAHFNKAEDYPGFMNEGWFDENDLKSFYEKMFSKTDSTQVDQTKETGVEEQMTDSKKGKEVQNLETEKKDDLMMTSHALQALAIYTPESSQEQQVPASPIVKKAREKRIAYKSPQVSFDQIRKKLQRTRTDETPVQRKSPRLMPVQEENEETKNEEEAVEEPEQVQEAIQVADVEIKDIKEVEGTAVAQRKSPRLKTLQKEHEEVRKEEQAVADVKEFEGTAVVQRKSPRLKTPQKQHEEAEKEEQAIEEQAVEEQEIEVCDLEQSPLRQQRKKIRATKQRATNKRKATIQNGMDTVKKMKRNTEADKSEEEEVEEEVEEDKSEEDEVEEEAEEEDKSKENEEGDDEETETKEEREEEEREQPKKILTRAYPSTFSKAVSKLSSVQRDWVIKAGFGPLLSFSLGETLPHSTIVNCLWWFDHMKCQMALHPKRDLKIKEEDVYDILGLPKGDLEVTFGSLNERKKHWVAQFPTKTASRVTEKNVRDKMADCEEANDHFKENFMVLLANMFIRTTKGSFICPKILKFDGDYDNSNSYNWCKLLLDNLKEAHEQWWTDPHSQYYTGSYVFLLFFYLARTSHPDVKVKRTWPAFIGWKNSYIDERNKKEFLDDSFGKGDIIEFGKQVEQNKDVESNDGAGPSYIQGSDRSYLVKEYEAEDDFNTPRETIGGVKCRLNFSQRDEVADSIMSIAKDIQSAHDDASNKLDEKEILSKVEQEFRDLENMRKHCAQTLSKARTEFPNNAKLIAYENCLRSTYQVISNEPEKEWPFWDNNDWKTYDILMLHEHDRAFNKLVDIDDFLGELKIGGQIVDDDLYRRKSTREVDIFANKLRRVVRVGEYQKSPFLNRAIDFTKTKMTKDEENVWKWINGDRKSSMTEVFLWKGTTCLKHHIQTLQVDKRVVFNVIDVYTCVLNEDEKYRSSESPRRFFFSTICTLGNVVAGDATDFDLNFYKFRTNLDILLFKQQTNINDIDLVFFPILCSNHFYVVCFNLKNVSVEILDNNEIAEENISKYNAIAENLRQTFAEYIAATSPRKSSLIKATPLVRLDIKWKTSNNIDSGIFAMNHMETYMGNVRTWSSKFTAEGFLQKRQLERARQIYAARIINSPINYLKEKILEQIKSL